MRLLVSATLLILSPISPAIAQASTEASAARPPEERDCATMDSFAAMIDCGVDGYSRTDAEALIAQYTDHRLFRVTTAGEDKKIELIFARSPLTVVKICNISSGIQGHLRGNLPGQGDYGSEYLPSRTCREQFDTVLLDVEDGKKPDASGNYTFNQAWSGVIMSRRATVPTQP